MKKVFLPSFILKWLHKHQNFDLFFKKKHAAMTAATVRTVSNEVKDT